MRSPSESLTTKDIRSPEEEYFWQMFTLKVKQQFLNFLIFLINTFENFYNNQTEKNPITKGKSANEIFNFDDYVQNVRENQPFFERFVRTQGFINFIEQAHYPMSEERVNHTSDADLQFFKECTRKLSQENLVAVREM